MRALALGWLCGTLWLQHRPELPAAWLLLLFVLAGGLAFAAGMRLPRLEGWLRVALLVLAGASLGAGWSAWRAGERLAEALPPELEGRDLVVTGIVASLPEASASGRRFQFEIEQATHEAQAVKLPSRVALGWYGRRGAVPEVQPGERWQLTVRLKRPHGLANPQGFDVEAWWLTEGLRATGYVRERSAQRLEPFVFSLRDAVGRARVALRDRIVAALPDARYAGVIVALVVGDQRAIVQSDWQVFNRTGIGHLMSIRYAYDLSYCDRG